MVLVSIPQIPFHFNFPYLSAPPPHSDLGSEFETDEDDDILSECGSGDLDDPFSDDLFEQNNSQVI